MATTAPSVSAKSSAFQDKEKPAQVRNINIVAAKAVSDAIRTSLGPKGMDKMIQTKTGEVVITNDGATILKHISLVDLSAAQDVEAGDGTTSVVVFAGSLLSAAEGLLSKGIHPTAIAEGFRYAAAKAVEFLTEMATPVDLSDRNALIQAASTSLNSKVVSQHSSLLAPIAVDAVLQIVDPLIPDNADLKRVRIVKKVRGTIEDCELSTGMVLNQSIEKGAGGPQQMDKARIALLQFPVSAPKPDMDSQIVVTDYRQMDRILKEERQYLLNICKAIKRTGCNVVLVQKSILREGVSDLALHFLAKLKVLVIKDIEREEIEFIAMATGCRPIADSASLAEERLGSAEWVGEEGGVVRIRGVGGRTASVILRGANGLVLEEAERSLHDAMCVVRCLVKKGALLPGGGAPEIAVSRRLGELHATGPLAECIKAFASAMEAVPATLAENAGLLPLSVITQLRNRHALGHTTAGINMKTGKITDTNHDVVQPLLVSTSAVSLAAETVLLLLKIDDIISSR